MPLSVSKTFDELMREGKEAETDENRPAAEKLYERAIKMEPHNEMPYTRLMIVYRQQRAYEKELALINKGIKVFEEFYQKRGEKLIGRDKKAEQLSNALAKSLGQKGKKTEAQFYPEPIPKWLKRRKIVEKKLGK